MPDFQKLDSSIPVAPLAVIVMDSAKELGTLVNDHLVNFRHNFHNLEKNDPAFQGYSKDNYMVRYSNPRFGSGESKAQMRESRRGKDVFILTDVMSPPAGKPALPSCSPGFPRPWC